MRRDGEERCDGEDRLPHVVQRLDSVSVYHPSRDTRGWTSLPDFGNLPSSLDRVVLLCVRALAEAEAKERSVAVAAAYFSVASQIW
jgi:hypothetical protein